MLSKKEAELIAKHYKDKLSYNVEIEIRDDDYYDCFSIERFNFVGIGLPYLDSFFEKSKLKVSEEIFFILSVVHEYGHLHPNLLKKVEDSREYDEELFDKSIEEISDEMLEKKFFNDLEIEKKAWENSWELVENDIDLETFNLVRDYCLKTYQNKEQIIKNLKLLIEKNKKTTK